MDMKPIIPPVDKALLKSELTPDTLLRTTNKAGNELYVVGPEAVHVIREIGRLREIAFRNDGGGTGEPLDIDRFDTDPAYGYRQLVLWNPDAEEIIGGYRFCICDEAVFDAEGQPILTSSDKNATAIITSHSLRELEDTCDQLALLHKGGLILQSNVQDLKTSLFKVQIAFDRPFSEELFSSLQVENCRINGGVAQLILRGDKYEILARLKQLNPVLLDVLPLNLEEIFTYEMKELGYSFEDVLEKEAKNEEKSV